MKLKVKLREVQEVEEQLYKQDRLNMGALLDELSENGQAKDPNSLIGRAESYYDSLDNNPDRFWEWKKFGVLLNNLKSYLGNKTIPISDVDAGFIEDFQEYLLNEVGNNPNTVRRKLTSFKGMFLRMLKTKEITSDPFTGVDKVSSKPADRVKLSFDQINVIQTLKLERGSDLWHTRNYFMYSFYNAGIRFGDLCCLKWKNIIDTRLIYTMNKTGQQKSINQLEPMYRILIQYVENPGQYVTFSEWEPTLQRPIDPVKHCLKYVISAHARANPNDYIFPVLDEHYSDPQELRKKISSRNVIVNGHLKTIADKAGIQANISFHVSRHSFAHYALKKGMDLYAISKALGHSGLKVTEEYIKSFDEELLDKSMNQLF